MTAHLRSEEGSQRSAARILCGAGYAVVPFLRSPKRGEAERRQALGAERRTPWPASRSGRSPDRRRSPANDAGRRASRRSTAAFSFRRRAALSTGGGRALSPSPPAVSQLWQGARSAPGRSPDAARVPRLRCLDPRAPHRPRPGISPGAGHRKEKGLFSGLPFGSSRLHDASRSAPQRTRLRRV
jgi:hypothetical protein